MPKNYYSIYVPLLVYVVRCLTHAVTTHTQPVITPIRDINQPAHRLLCFLESGTFRSGTRACAATRNIYVLRMAFIITIIHTFGRFTINTDRFAGMLQRTGIGPFSLLRKTFTACIRTAVRMFAAYHNIALAAAFLLIVGTIFNSTF